MHLLPVTAFLVLTVTFAVMWPTLYLGRVIECVAGDFWAAAWMLMWLTGFAIGIGWVEPLLVGTGLSVLELKAGRNDWPRLLFVRAVLLLAGAAASNVVLQELLKVPGVENLSTLIIFCGLLQVSIILLTLPLAVDRFRRFWAAVPVKVTA